MTESREGPEISRINQHSETLRDQIGSLNSDDFILIPGDKDQLYAQVNFVRNILAGEVLTHRKNEQLGLFDDEESVSSLPLMDSAYLLSPFMGALESESLVGDLQEGYSRRFRESGHYRAARWYYGEICLSLWPLLRASLKRVSGWARLAELWRRIRR